MSAHEEDASRPCEHCGVTFDVHEHLAPRDCPANVAEPSDVERLACGIMRCILAPGHHGPHHPGDTWKSHEQQQPPSDVERAKDDLKKFEYEHAAYYHSDLRVVLSDHDRLTRELREANEGYSLLCEEVDRQEAEVSDLRAKLDAAEAQVNQAYMDGSKSEGKVKTTW